MSGASDTIECPRCGGQMQTYTDWKPHDMVSGFCLDCGYAYRTICHLMPLEAVNGERESYHYPFLEQLREPSAEWQEAKLDDQLVEPNVPS